MSGYVLTPTAQQDLLQIRDYYWEQAGYRIARQVLTEFVEAFQFLGRNPGAGHKREDLAEARPILFWPMRDYLILYKPGTDPLQVATIVRGSRDIPRIVGRRGL
jgi:plasmid stabilization system protein ParE